MTRTNCPYCGTIWQFITDVEGRYAYIHFCEELERYVGWGDDGVPFEVHKKYIYPKE